MIYLVTSKYSQKLHEKCIDLSCSYGETETILGKYDDDDDTFIKVSKL